MRTSLSNKMGAIAVIAAATIALAACGGGGGLNEDEAAGLRDEVKVAEEARAAAENARRLAEEAATAARTAQEAAENAQRAAEAERDAAVTARETAEEAQAAAERAQETAEAAQMAAEGDKETAETSAAEAARMAQEAADRAAKAETDLAAAQRARERAETERDAARDAEREAERDRVAAEAALAEARRLLTAEQQRAAAEEEARLAAEAEQERLREEAEKARQEASRADASKALIGLGTEFSGASVMVIPKYSALADITTTPSVDFEDKSRSSASGWSITRLSNSDATNNDNLVVYSNAGRPTRELLTAQDVRFVDDDLDTAGTLIFATMTDSDERLIRSGSFPTRDGEDKPFPNNFENDPDSPGRDIVRISGSFRGVSGHFQCASQPCTIGRRGDRYDLVAGTWTFHTTDAARVSVDDMRHMYFGWWIRQPVGVGNPSFLTFADGAAALASGDAANFNALGGTATYRGPAVGQYAIYQPLGTQSGAGSFTASAALTANFGTNMLSGTVTNFSNSADWAVTLGATAMTDGTVSAVDGGDKVVWTIGTDRSAQLGDWTATFYSEAEYVGQTPDGVVGQFTAVFDNDATEGGEVGRILGAFGARK